MTEDELKGRLREVARTELPLPGAGETARRYRALLEMAREDLSLAKLAEAHWDAVAILAEAGRGAEPGRLYGVWASEIPGSQLELERMEEGYRLHGRKPFCSGLGLVDWALVTVGNRLVDVDMREVAGTVEMDLGMWSTEAFRMTGTGGVMFGGARVAEDAVVGERDWYLTRPGFWHGACGPAACWVGGVAGLVDYAIGNKRHDAHTLAHLGAMEAMVWGLRGLLDCAGDEIDATPGDCEAAQMRALRLRGLVEQMGSDILRRFARAYGPHPMAMDREIARRYQEADLYLRQWHGERDLEVLGRMVHEGPKEGR
jgi:alkylation response protein AidB-like acyl-CoA dehydrogenase